MGGNPPPSKEQAPLASNSPAPPNLTSDTKNLEPTPPVVTSDILPSSIPRSGSPRPGSNGHFLAGRLDQQPPNPPRPHAEPPQSASLAPTPRTSRLEVVLNLSPFKKFSGHQAFDEADLEDDELMTADLTPRKRQRAPPISSASRQVAPVTTASVPAAIKRPRGRPKGWRPGMPSTKTGLPTASSVNPTSAAKPGSAPKSTGQKRRGRPPRPPSPTARNVWETMTPPKYIPFQCEWENCRAELQNVKTLRKHIRVVHGNLAPLVCRWAKCAKTGQPPVFTQDSEFQDHVDSAHLVPCLWHCGDGHSNNKCVIKKTSGQGQDKIQDYLLGPEGGQVTPSVRDQAVEDALKYRDNRRRLKRTLFQRDANALSEEDEAEESGPP